MEHKLVDGTLKRDEKGITARCECGWVSGGHFTSLAASAAMQAHQEQQEEDWPSHGRVSRG